MVQRHSFLRSDGQCSNHGYILTFTNFGTKALVTGTGLQVTVEQNTQEISEFVLLILQLDLMSL